jgi:hypothetical protein
VFILGLIMIIGALVVNFLVMARMNGCDDDVGKAGFFSEDAGSD